MEGDEPPEDTDWAEATGLPREFEAAEAFRQGRLRGSEPAPRPGLPPALGYAVLFPAMAAWCYYGYRFGETHAPVSLTAVLAFFGVLLVLVLTTVVFWARKRRVALFATLERIAAPKPGAFVVVSGGSPALFYARATWIGRVGFRTGGEHQSAFTRLDARLSRPLDRMAIRRKRLLGRIIGRAGGEAVALPDDELSRKFIVSGADPGSVRSFLDPTVADALVRLARLGDPAVEIAGTRVRVEVDNDLSAPRAEASLVAFLSLAETIVGAASHDPLRAVPSPDDAIRGAAASAPARFLGRLALVGASVALAIAAVVYGSAWAFHQQAVSRAEELKRLSGEQDPSSITERDLERLPEEVRRYLRFAGAVGKRRISAVRYRGTGSFRSSPSGPWQAVYREQFFTTRRPSVCGYARKKVRFLTHVAYFDSYIEGRARMIAKGLSIFPLRDASDDDAARAMFLKLITGTPVYPTVLLDGALVRWQGSDGTSVAAVFSDGGLEWPAAFFFGDDGSIARVELTRPRAPGGHAPLERWTGTYGEYGEFGGFRLPTRFESAWNLEERDVTFATFTADAIELE